MHLQAPQLVLNLLLALPPVDAAEADASADGNDASTEGDSHSPAVATDRGSSDEDEEALVEEFLGLSLVGLMDGKIIVATKREQTLSAAPAVVTVISAEQISDRGYRSVGEALESIPGVDMLHDHYQYNLGSRGVNGGKRAWSRIVKVMIDGQPVDFRPSSENVLGEELIPIEVVERIEVVRGPGSALYGADAYLGVVNIVTKSGEDVEWGKVVGRFDGGSNSIGGAGTGVVGGRVGRFDFVAAAKALSIAEHGYEVVPVPGASHPLEGRSSQQPGGVPQSYFARATFDGGKYGVVSTDFNLQHVDRNAEFQDWGPLTRGNRFSYNNLYARLKYAVPLGRHFKLNSSVAYSRGQPTRRDRFDFDEDETSWVTREMGYDAVNANVEGVVSIDDSSNIRVGVDLENEDFDVPTYYAMSAQGRDQPNPGQPNRVETVFRNLGAYAQMSLYPWRLAKARRMRGLSLTAGARVDVHSIYGVPFNYRVGFVHEFRRPVYVKALFGTSFKAPAPYQLFTNQIAPRGVIGNPDLKPERAQTAELVVGARIGQHVGLVVDGFASQVKDKVELQIVPALDNETARNAATIQTLGLEAELALSIRHFNGFANYSLSSSAVRQRDFLGQEYRVPASLYPTHMAKLGVNYKIPKAFLKLNLEGRYTGKRLASESNSFFWDPVDYQRNRYEIPGYVIVDAMIATHDLRPHGEAETEIRFKVYNLFGRKYTYPGFSDFDIPGFARTFSVLLSQSF